MALIAPFGGYIAVMEEIYPPGTPEILEGVLFMLLFILVLWIPPWLVLPPWFQEYRWHGGSDFGFTTTFGGIWIGGFTGLALTLLIFEQRSGMVIFSIVVMGPILAFLWWFSLARSPANYNPRWVLATGVGSTIGTFFALRRHISLETTMASFTTATFTEGVLSGIIYSLCYSIVTIVLLKWAVKGGRETTEW
ncbi:MAG: hypothetical protein AAGF95_30580 [Chloroflexota bacterium]